MKYAIELYFVMPSAYSVRKTIFANKIALNFFFFDVVP